jgi:hypothetical protein
MPARLTPYELAFGLDRFEHGVFPSIRDEAEARHVDTSVRERFLMLGTVGELLRELRPDNADLTAVTDSPLPPPDAVREYGALLFQAFRFHDRGRRLFTVAEQLLRDVLQSDAAGEWRFAAPHDAGYLQLPRHLVWARIDEPAPPEAVDGFFWSVVESDGGRPGSIELLLALGMHSGRPGFSVVEAVAPLPPPAPGHWGDQSARPDGTDFANILPGGEMRNLLAVTSTTELLKLVSRLFHYIDLTPASLVPAPSATQGDDPGHGLPASSIAATAITDPDSS